ncbi:hypothetical protein [Sulfitobacter dubius]|nr:hypothetical protein [Sulfitobacter dubius]MCZ4367711.1 hypothetical protein [Sulfitobacter dubius]
MSKWTADQTFPGAGACKNRRMVGTRTVAQVPLTVDGPELCRA